jgi:hypothetical protein
VPPGVSNDKLLEVLQQAGPVIALERDKGTSQRYGVSDHGRRPGTCRF